MTMNRLDFLMMTESLMGEIEGIIDAELDQIVSDRLKDELVRRVCDKVCEIMDPAGLE